MAYEPFVLATPAVGGRGLRVTVRWLGDRYGHSIDVSHDGQWFPLLQSIEGTELEEFPPSPPLQQLHVESRDETSIALLVGMAGKNYWSMSVESRSIDMLTFDVACRTNSRALQLRSSYRSPRAANASLVENGLDFEIDGACGRLNLVDAAPDGARIELAQQQFVIIPKSDAGTVRWKYSVTPGDLTRSLAAGR
jgi:hypothetical protein